MTQPRGDHSGASPAYLLALLLAALPSCDAHFIDLRPSSAQGALDAGSGGDAADADIAELSDDRGLDAIGPDAPDLGTDAGMDPDGGDDAGAVADRVLRVGSFEGRTGYSASGTGEIVALSGGGLEVRLSDDFASQAVPGPVVVLSSRDSLGTALDDGADTVVATLSSASGAQTYAVAAADEDTAREAAWLWIYCQPFGVEVARASLEEAP